MGWTRKGERLECPGPASGGARVRKLSVLVSGAVSVFVSVLACLLLQQQVSSDQGVAYPLFLFGKELVGIDLVGGVIPLAIAALLSASVVLMAVMDGRPLPFRSSPLWLSMLAVFFCPWWRLRWPRDSMGAGASRCRGPGGHSRRGDDWRRLCGHARPVPNVAGGSLRMLCDRHPRDVPGRRGTDVHGLISADIVVWAEAAPSTSCCGLGSTCQSLSWSSEA